MIPAPWGYDLYDVGPVCPACAGHPNDHMEGCRTAEVEATMEQMAEALRLVPAPLQHLLASLEHACDAGWSCDHTSLRALQAAVEAAEAALARYEALKGKP